MNAGIVHVVARISAAPEKLDEVSAILRGLVAPTRAEAGCLQYDLLQSGDSPTDFVFVEQWRSAADLEAHLASEHLRNAQAQLPDLLVEAPDIRTFEKIE